MTRVTDTAGYQNWRCLAFLHWRVPAEELQRLVPESLTIEQRDGSAWLGLVPFSMERIRPWWAPAVPGVSWFLETNVRTYVVDEQGRTGVWFFSLDANSRIAVSVARRFWHLPYVRSQMSLRCDTPAADNRESLVPQSVSYFGTRIESPSAEYSITLKPKPCAPATAEPGSLDEFLLERYLLFAESRDGSIRTGRVHHEPYRFVPLDECSATQSLTDAMGCPINPARKPDHAVWSPGVDVRVSKLQSPAKAARH